MPRKPNTTGTRYNDPFPTRLRKLMEERKMIQEDLKDVLGVSTRQSVTGYIDGSTLPTPDKIVAVAKFFGVTTDYLLKPKAPRSIDPNIRAICDYTGLSDAAVENLHSGLGFRSEELQEAGRLLLNFLLSEKQVTYGLLLNLLDATRQNKELLRELEELQARDPEWQKQGYKLARIRKDVVFTKYNATERFGEFYDSITGYKDAKVAIEAAINQELQK